jgi:hypothetical protein
MVERCLGCLERFHSSFEEPVRSASGVETGKPCAGQKYRIESSSPNTLVKQFTHTASLQPGLLQGE